MRRPPAKLVHDEPQPGLLGRVRYGTVDQGKNYGPSGTTQLPIRAFWQDRVQVNPAHEQPKLVLYSAAQPFIRWGMLRRYTRTYMSSSPRFQGRWAYVGFIQRRFTERARMTGVATRQGTTYQTPTPSSAPGWRLVTLGANRIG
jgi:hypothetical protein